MVRPMSVMLTVLLNGLFLLVFGISVMNAWYWGEMAGIPRGGDKSGLGGLMGVMMFMALRWLCIGALLLIALWRGGLDFVPGGTWGKIGIVIGVHLAIGIASYLGFSWVSSGLTHDNMEPQKWCWFFAFVLPIPALLLAWQGLNPGFAARSPKMAVVLVLVVILCHAQAFRSNMNDMRARRVAARAV